MKKTKLFFFGAVAGSCLAICLLLGVLGKASQPQGDTTVTLTLSQTGQTITLPLEEYGWQNFPLPITPTVSDPWR